MPKKKTEKTPEKEVSKSKKKEKLSQAEFEKKVVELAKKGLTAEKTGEVLKREGIHPKEFNKKISRILKEKELYQNPDLKNVQEKFERIEKHTEKNTQDKRAIREKSRVFSQLRKLKKYHGVKIK